MRSPAPPRAPRRAVGSVPTAPAPLLALVALAALAASASAQAPRVQTDWSGGPGHDGPAHGFGTGFQSASGVAWKPIAGQVALAGAPVAGVPPKVVIDAEQSVARSPVAADVDGDGDDDVIAAGYHRIDWYERLHGDSFAKHAISTTFEGAYDFAPADLDLDGDLDVAVAAFYGGPGLGENGRFAWFEQTGGDAWVEHTFAEGYWGAESLDLADVDGDGDLDVCGISSLDDDVIWFENADGVAGAWLPHPVDKLSGAIDVVAADLDGDGDPDLAVAAYGASVVRWYENDGAGAFAAHPLFQVSTADGIDAGDLDGDGDLDLVASGVNSPNLLWIENLDGHAGAWTLHSISGWPRGEACLARDVDGDGDLDVVANNDQLPAFAQIYWFENAGTASAWAPHELDGFLDHVSGLAVGDVDADGKLDVLSALDIQRDVVFYRPTSFLPAGELVSSWVQRLPDERWWRAAWDADVPAGATLAVDVRTARSLASPSRWTTVPAPGSALAGLVDPAATYLQYRLRMTGAPAASPVVRDVTIGAAVLSVEGAPSTSP